jgi:hypothetical protein
MHPEYWPHTRDRIREGGLIVANSSLVVDDLGRPDCETFMIPAGDIANDMGAPMSAGYVLVSAYAAITAMVTVDSLVSAMRELVPAYRTQHLTSNEAAIRAGFDAAPRDASPAWKTTAAEGAEEGTKV